MKGKSEQVKEILIREIWAMGLRCGDSLPSCGELSERLHLSRSTVFRGVKILCDEGILESKDRVGYFLKDARTPGHSSYNVGIIIGNKNASAFNNLLTIYLQSQCQDSGCQGIMFHASGAVLHKTREEDSLAAHVGVREQIERGTLHGLISQIALSDDNLSYLQSKNIPCCFIGGYLQSGFPLSVTLNMEQLIGMACEHLESQGYHQPLFLLPALIDNRPHQAVANYETLTYAGIRDLVNIARKLVGRARASRPDAIFIPDNVGAEYFMTGLYSFSSVNYQPHLVVTVPEENLPAETDSIYYPLPAGTAFLTYSVTELSRMAVQLLLNTLHGKHGDSHLNGTPHWHRTSH